MNIIIIVKDKLQTVCRMRVKVKMKENGRIIMDKLQGYGRIPWKGTTAGVSEVIRCGLFQGIIQKLLGVIEKNGKFSKVTLTGRCYENNIQGVPGGIDKTSGGCSLC
jgi:hypothetical protein